MGDLDQRLRPLANGFAVQIGNAIFSHHIADQPARRHHARTRVQRGHDAGNVPSFSRRGKSDDRLAALGVGRAAQEVHLPADAAVEVVADRIRADLSGQIDLQAPS